MKVIFINLYDFVDLNRNSLPLGILSLATILKDSNEIKSEIIDFHRIYENNILKKSDVLSENISNCYDYIAKYDPDIICLYTMHNTLHIAILLANEIKTKNSSVKVVLGGPQASLCAKEIIKNFNDIDAIGIGEGELTISKNLMAIKSGNFENSNGLCYRQNGEVMYIDNENLISDLDELPFVDYDLLKFPIKNNISIDVGRGCPFACSFCSTKTFWKRKFRIKSAERIYEEIKFYSKKYGVNSFSLQHDLFVSNRKLVFDFCKLLKDNNFKIEWWCSSRVDLIDEELLKEMSSAGCTGIYFGVETGSSRMQKIINKNLNLERIDFLIDILKKYNVNPTFSFIYGFPEEEYEDLDKTLSMIYKLYNAFKVKYKKRIANLQLHKLIFLSETELTLKYHSKLSYSKNYHTDASLSLNKWNDMNLKSFIKNKNIFPHLFEYKSDIRCNFKYLDVIFNTIFMNSIDYYESTYRLLLNFFDNSHVKLLKSFKEIITDNDVEKCYHYYHNNMITFLETIFTIIRKFILNYDFGEYTEAIIEIFDYEMSIYEILNPNIKKEDHYYIRHYNYNVFDVKKYGLNKTTKCSCYIEYKIEGKNISVNKLTNKSVENFCENIKIKNNNIK